MLAQKEVALKRKAAAVEALRERLRAKRVKAEVLSAPEKLELQRFRQLLTKHKRRKAKAIDGCNWEDFTAVQSSTHSDARNHPEWGLEAMMRYWCCGSIKKCEVLLLDLIKSYGLE